MPRLAILRPPFSMRSAHGIAGPETVAGLAAAGIQCEGHDLWPEWMAKWLWHSRIPGRRRLFDASAARYGLWRLSKAIRRNDWIWISGPSRPYDAGCAFERELLRAGMKYIFHLLDDWFSVDGLRELALARLPLANLVVVPTPPLKRRVLEFAPLAKVLCLEEPIDIDRLAPIRSQTLREPMLVWCGNPHNLKEVPNCAQALEHVYRKLPFRLRIICGRSRPALTLPVPWEWHAYDSTK